MPTNYEPSDEIRVFSGGEDDEDVEGSRLPLLIVIALLVLAAFGGVVWLAYQRGVQQGHSDVPRVIAAEPGPAKVAPTSPGGTPTPYTGLKIYQQPAQTSEQPAATPPPTRIVTQTVPPTPAPTASAPAPASAAVKPAPATSPPAALTKPAPVHAAQVAPIRPSIPATEAPAPSAAPPATGDGILQIGSYKSEADAGAAWIAYKAKHSALLAGMTADIKQVDLGAKGTWFRLRIVAADKSAAVALCDKLKAEGAACIPAR